MPTQTKVVVVAGASSGIGLSACKQFAERGYLVAAGALDPNAAALRQAAESAPENLYVVPMDVIDDASVDSAFAEIFDEFERVDVLVNSAGAGCIGALEECSLAELEHTMAVNFFGAVRTTKAVLPRMREAGSGRLIAVSSLGGPCSVNRFRTPIAPPNSPWRACMSRSGRWPHSSACTFPWWNPDRSPRLFAAAARVSIVQRRARRPLRTRDCVRSTTH